MNDYEAIVTELRQRRLAGQFTQETLAKLAGLHRSQIARMESGTPAVGLAMLMQIARALGCKIEVRPR